MSLLKNISRYQELHADIGELPLYNNIHNNSTWLCQAEGWINTWFMNISTVKQVLPELVAILPNSDRSVEQPIEVTVTICHILINLSHASVSNTSAIINQGALPKIISISTKDNGYGFIFRKTRFSVMWCIIKLTIKLFYVTYLIHSFNSQLNLGLDPHVRARRLVFYFIPYGGIQSCIAVSKRWNVCILQ